jgi:hypothetical protein
VLFFKAKSGRGSISAQSIQVMLLGWSFFCSIPISVGTSQYPKSQNSLLYFMGYRKWELINFSLPHIIVKKWLVKIGPPPTKINSHAIVCKSVHVTNTCPPTSYLNESFLFILHRHTYC